MGEKGVCDVWEKWVVWVDKYLDQLIETIEIIGVGFIRKPAVLHRILTLLELELHAAEARVQRGHVRRDVEPLERADGVRVLGGGRRPLALALQLSLVRVSKGNT